MRKTIIQNFMKSIITKLVVVLLASFFLLPSSFLFAASDPITEITALTGTASGSIMLNWTYPGPTDLTNGGTYYIQYSSWTNSSEIVWSTANAQIVISTTSAAAFSLHGYSCNGLGNGVTSYFRVWLSSSNSASFDISGISDGATNYAKPYIFDTTPNSVTSLVVISTGTSAAKLSWTSVNNSDILGYTIYRSSSPATIGYSLRASVSNSTTYYFENGLAADVTYYYIVRSSDTIQQSSALLFQVTNNVAVSASQSLNASKDLSVAFWINPNNTTTFQSIIFKSDWNGSWKIMLPWSPGEGGNSGKVEFSGPNRTWGTNALQSGAGKVPSDQWTHVVCVYNSKTQISSIYINGSIDQSLSSVPTMGAEFNGAVSFGNDGANHLNAALSEVMIYNRPLSDVEIGALYNSNLPSSFGLVSWWKLNHVFPSHTTANDTLGINNGLISGENFATTGVKGGIVSILANGALAAGPSALYAPQDGSWTNWTEADWADVPGAANYNLQVANNSGFSPTLQDATFAASQGSFSGLSESTLYWWRARADMGEGVYTGWSSTKTFRLDNTKPQILAITGQKSDTSWVNATTVYVDTYPVNVAGSARDQESGLRAGQTEIAASSGCVMLMHMNEGSGTILTDVSGYGNNGKAESGASWTGGKFVNGLAFDGTTSSVTVANNASLNPANITAEAWIYPTGKDGEQALLEKRGGGSFNIALFGNSGVYDVISNVNEPGDGTNGTQVYAKAYSAINQDVWTHVAMTYDGSYVKLYLNGVVVASSQTIAVVNITGSTKPIKIGSNDDYGLFYQGKMDDVSMFNRALNADEIAAQYNSGAFKYSTDNGTSWTLVNATNLTQFSGADGSTGFETAKAFSVPFKESTSNKIKYEIGDMAGNMVESSAFTVLVDTTPPPKINDLAVASGTAVGDMRMTWTVPTDLTSGMTAGRYQVKYSSVPTDVYTIPFDTNAASGWQTYVATGLPINTYFWFNVQARDNAGNWNIVSDSVSYRYVSDPTPPAGISNLTALPGTTNRTITLRWTAPGNDEMANALIGGSFQVRYSSHGIITAANYNNAPYSNYSVNIATTVNPGDPCTYTTPATLIPSATYWFAVKTYDGANWSVWKSSGDVSTVNTLAWSYASGSSDLTAPAAITTLSGLVGNDGQINLTWTSPGDDGTTGNLPAGSQFSIQYATYSVVWSTSSAQVVINAQGSIPFSATTYQLNGLKPNATYYVRIWTVDEGPNLSVISNGATIYLTNSPTSYIPADAAWTNTPYADWSDVPDAADYMAIFDNNSNFSSPEISSAPSISRADIASLAENTYWYKVRARLWSDVFTAWSSTKTFRLDYTKPVVSNLQSLSNTSVSVSVADSVSGLRVGQAEIAASSGCVMLMHMNEGSGTVLTDISGYGNNGKAESGASWTTGKFTNGMSFNGTTSSVTVANNVSLNPAYITAEAWIYPTGKDGEQALLEKRGGGSFNIALYGNAGVYDVFANMNEPGDGTKGTQIYAKAYSAISANTWTHVAVTYDGSKINLYLNGVVAASSDTIAVVNITGSSQNLKLGSKDDTSVFYQGKMDEVAIFNRALSSEEIAAHYYSGTVKYSINGDAGPWTFASAKTVMTATDITATNIPFSNDSTKDRVIFLAQDNAGNIASTVFTVTGDTTPPAAINNLSVSGKTETSLTLTWASPGDDGGVGALPAGSLFNIQYSSFVPVSWSTASAQVSFSAAGTAAGATVSRDVSSLIKDTTYYFRAWTADEKSQWSAISNGATDYTSNDTVAPTVTGAVIEKVGILGQPIVFLSTATDTSAVAYIKLWYKLYDAAWASADMALIDVAGGKAGEYVLAGSNVNKEGTIAYYLQAADNQGNIGYWKSQATPQEITVSRTTVFSPIQTGSVALPNNDTTHGQVELDIPAGALSGPVAITITQDNPLLDTAANDDTVDRAKNGGKPVASYTFEPSGTKFAKPITLTLLYFDPNDTGAIQLEDGTSAGINENTSVMQIFYWDGVNWRLLGGTVDKTKNTVSIKINHFSKYAIFPLGSALLKAAPDEKFVTPNMPASFGYKADEVVIMDIAGNTVKEIKKTDFGGSSIQWNGYDESGKFVESGVYLFKIKTDENKTTYGMIVVAK